MKPLHDTINDRYIISTYFDKAAKTYITSVTDKHTFDIIKESKSSTYNNAKTIHTATVLHYTLKNN